MVIHDYEEHLNQNTIIRCGPIIIKTANKINLTMYTSYIHTLLLLLLIHTYIHNNHNNITIWQYFIYGFVHTKYDHMHKY